jgi:hypothetical protein
MLACISTKQVYQKYVYVLLSMYMPRDEAKSKNTKWEITVEIEHASLPTNYTNFSVCFVNHVHAKELTFSKARITFQYDLLVHVTNTTHTIEQCIIQRTKWVLRRSVWN